MTNLLYILSVLVILITSLYIYYRYLKYTNRHKINTLLVIRELHPEAVIEDFIITERGVIVESTGTGIYPENGRLKIFEFNLRWINGKLEEQHDYPEIPYDKRSFKHELTTPEKVNHWRKDQLDTENKNARVT